ncbi:hypothetical protein [Trichococcus ilyis]|uniref:PepSY domain-containing protein n=1 Tax=Trichococcus ilyis TaxID=640938 RepID=A0A143Z8Z0_9LACT|nr:hypothetical protein [Trichococcus ilyis]CZR07226.1 Hypothetical protein TR210_2416 [Trichococcus ilyis]SEJ93326.1 hypothetical protein SAMN05216375_14111 [Trichococcus ilyis]
MKNKQQLVWGVILFGAIAILIGYSIWLFLFAKSAETVVYNQGYYNSGMMGGRVNSNQNSSNEKLAPDQILTDVENYLKAYGNNLQVADIFIFTDADYYVSVEEKDTGRGAMELLINPYTGQIYPEPGPNMMWNEKYSMMMGGFLRYNANETYTATVNRTEAVKIADDFVKSQLGESFSVPGEGHAFYGYYTFHIMEDDKVIGMLSVNDLTGEVWYHDWHGDLEQVISEH